MYFTNSLHHLIEISLPLTRLIELQMCVAYHSDEIYIMYFCFCKYFCTSVFCMTQCRGK